MRSSKVKDSLREPRANDFTADAAVNAQARGSVGDAERRGSVLEPEPPTIDGHILAALRNWVERHYGLSFSVEQHEHFAGRIAALCCELVLTGETLLSKLSAGDQKVALRMAEAVSTNYTFFRREPTILDYFAAEVLPSLPAGPLRFWSAATSSGDEAYGIAIASHEHFGGETQARVRILGTDISERQLRIAELGVYPREQIAQLGAAHVERWFSPAERGQLRISDTLKQLCTFRRLNLTQDKWPFTNRFHVIFLRNVLYYFEPAVRRQILERCFDATEPGGVLLTSLTEPMIDVSTRWCPVRPAVFRRAMR